MSRNKVAITVNQNTLDQVDQLVRQHIFPSRSRAFEKSLAEEGLSGESDEWPEC